MDFPFAPAWNRSRLVISSIFLPRVPFVNTAKEVAVNCHPLGPRPWPLAPGPSALAPRPSPLAPRPYLLAKHASLADLLETEFTVRANRGDVALRGLGFDQRDALADELPEGFA